MVHGLFEALGDNRGDNALLCVGMGMDFLGVFFQHGPVIRSLNNW